MKSRPELDTELDQFEVDLPALLADTREECRVEAFAGIADEIREQAGPKDAAHVWSRLECMLRDAGLSPGDEKHCSS